jgi:hypothetical protein
MICSRVRPARVGDVAGLTQIAVRATKHNGYDDGAISRFMPGLKINLALIAAGLVFVAEDEQGVPHGYVALRPTGMGGLVLLEGISSIRLVREAVLARDFSRPQLSIQE